MVSARGPKTGSVFLASLECLPGNQPVHRAQCKVLMNRLGERPASVRRKLPPLMPPVELDTDYVRPNTPGMTPQELQKVLDDLEASRSSQNEHRKTSRSCAGSSRIPP